MVYLKLCSVELAPILTLIFQASIHQSANWKQANVVPIFKKGDCTQCNNHRPPVMFKITRAHPYILTV